MRVQGGRFERGPFPAAAPSAGPAPAPPPRRAGKGGRFPSIKSLLPWHLVSPWPSRGWAAPLCLPRRPALPCPEERCWRCAAALLPPSFPSPGIAELHILDLRGSRPAALSQPRGHRGLFSQPPCSAVRAQEARPPSRPGSAQAAVSAPRVPAGTPKQSLFREDFLGLSPWKGGGWRALPQRR